MADRYELTDSEGYGNGPGIFDHKIGQEIANAHGYSQGQEIVAALNAVERLKAAVWGPEGVPAWLEGSEK